MYSSCSENIQINRLKNKNVIQYIDVDHNYNISDNDDYCDKYNKIIAPLFSLQLS